MKQAEAAVRQNPVAEEVEQLQRDVGPEIGGQYADRELQLDRHGVRGIAFEIAAGQAIDLEEVADAAGEGVIDLQTADAIRRDKDGAPGSGKLPGSPRRLQSAHAQR